MVNLDGSFTTGCRKLLPRTLRGIGSWRFATRKDLKGIDREQSKTRASNTQGHHDIMVPLKPLGVVDFGCRAEPAIYKVILTIWMGRWQTAV